jgi:hypothetical protein
MIHSLSLYIIERERVVSGFPQDRMVLPGSQMIEVNELVV